MPDDLSSRLRRPAWLTFFGGILLAWAMLYAMQLPALPPGAGADFWRALCTVEPGTAGYPTAVLMWALMTAAMMAPGFVPALRTYDDIARGAHFWPFVGGYLSVWLGASAVAAALQLGLASAALTTPAGQSLSPLFTALLLIGAGAYQFSPLKQACLSRCRAPFAVFLAIWRDGAGGAARMGGRLGVDCLGCCWALMLLAFAGGAMNLALMGVATVLMTVEKLPQIGQHVTRPLGGLLVAGGAFLAGATL